MKNFSYLNYTRKTITFFLLLAGIVLHSSAQMYFRETFETQFTPNTALGPNAPVGWTQTRQGTTIASPTGSTTTGAKDWAWMSWNGSAWSCSTLPNTNYSGNGTAPASPFQGNGVIWFNDAFTSTAGQNQRRLESPDINLSASTDPVIKLTYWYVSGSATVKIQGSINGTAWSDLQTLTTTGANWITYTIPVPAGLRTATFKVGMQVTNAFQSQGIWLDDVSIFDYGTTFTSSSTGGDWSNPASWAGGVAPVLSKGTENITITAGSSVIMDIASTIGSLTIASGGTLSLNNNLTSNGNLTVNNNGILNSYTGLTGNTITLLGNLSNAGTINMSKQGSILNLSGTSVQDINGNFTSNIIPALTVNNTAGVTLNTNIKIPVALNLTKGILSGSGILTLGDIAFSNSFTMISTGGSASCAVTSGLSGVENVTYTYNPSTPVASYSTGTELSVTSPNLNIVFAAMSPGNYQLGTDVTANNITFNDTVTINSPGTLTVLGNAMFTSTTIVNGSGMFSLGPNAKLSTLNIAGITASALSGSVQTISRFFNSGADYIYGGASGQETGDGLPTFFTTGSVTVNSNALTLSQTTSFNNLILNANLITASGKDVTINGVGNLGTFAITGSGTFTAGAASRLMLNSTHSNGVLQTGSNGNIQVTGSKTFNTGIDIVIGGSAVATGNAFPATGIDSLILNHTTTGGVILTNATSANTLLIANTGRLITTPTNLLSILGTGAASITVTGSGYIDGPLSRKVPLAASGSYLFPIGKSTTASAQAVELLNPAVTGSTLTVVAEVMNASAAGTAGAGITSLNTNRYWKIWPVTGGTLTANVKVYESSMNNANKVASATGPSPATTYVSAGGLVHTNISITGFNPVLFATGTDTTYFVLGSGVSNGTFAGGTYPIGPSATYKSIGEALANINNNADLSGPVVLELQPSYAPSIETYPIAFPQTLPTSSANTLTIRPAATVVSAINFTGITSGTNIPLFDMNGTKHIRIDGRPGGTGNDRYIAITQTGNNPAMRMINDAQNIVIRRVTLSASNTSATSGVIVFSTAAGSLASNGNNNDTLDFCILNGNSQSINTLYASGSASPADNKNCVITNCHFIDFYNNGGAIAGLFIADGNTSWVISNNTIYQTAVRTASSSPALTAAITVRGIYISNTSGNAFKIINNKIGGNLPGVPGSSFTFADNTISAAANSLRGIELNVGNASASSLQGNTIQGINLFSTTNSDIFMGIYVSAGSVNTGDSIANTIGSTVSNNSVFLTQIGTTTATGYGIRYATSGGNIQNNLVGGIALDIVRPTSTGSLLFHGINASGTHTVPLFIANNLIGSLSTPDNIYGTASAVSGIGMVGILLNGATGRAVTVKSNTLANITNDNSTTSANAYVLGIWATGASSVSTTITENAIYNVSNASRNTSSAQNAAIVGIATNTSGAGPQIISANSIYSIAQTNTLPVAGSVMATGIYYSSTSSNATLNRIDRNLVHSFKNGGVNTPSAQTGIAVAGGSTRVNVSNNMIRLGIEPSGTSAIDTISITGIYKTGGVMSAFFNSIYIGGNGVGSGTASSYAFRRTGSNTDSVMNNIFFNARSGSASDGSHYAISLTNTNTLTLNYNCYYAGGNGGYIGQLNGVTQATLAMWQIAGAQDQKSFSANPSFINPVSTSATVNLHISPSTPTPVEGTGIFIATVSSDFDGNNRSSLTPTDIGAHSGNFIPRDAIPPTIVYSPLDIAPSSALTRILTATISDATGIDTTAASKPRLYYKRMASGIFVSSPGMLISGNALNGSWSFTIDHAAVGGISAGDSIYYFVAAQDTATSANIGSYPPGAEGGNTSAIFTYPTFLNSYQIRAAIHGNFLVGASHSAPDYPSLTAAMADIQTKILDGNINLLLQSDYQSSLETFPILLTAFNKDSTGRTVTIKPDVGVTPTITSTAISVIKISGGDYYIIDGSNNGTNSRDLTLYNAGTTANSSVMWIASASGSDGASNNIIKNCIISGLNKTTTEVAVFSGGPTGAGAGSFNALTPNSNNIIQNNLVMKAKYALWFKGVSATILDSNNLIDKNEFGTANAADGFNEGIFVMQLQKNALITKNNVQGLAGNGTGTADIAGSSTIMPVLYLRQSNNCTLNGNKVFNINYSGTSRVHCIFVEAPAFNTVGNPSNNLIINNAVYNVRLSGASGWMSGINGNGGYGDRFYFNSVYLTGVLNTSNSTIAAFSNGNSSTAVATSTIQIKNNIFYINGSSSSTATFYAHYTPNATTYNGSSLSNNLLRSISTSTATAYTGYNGTAQASLSDWQAGTLQEINSINTDPAFPSSTNLTPGPGSVVIGAGTFISGIGLDINDSVRSNPPSIGAYENGADFAPPAITFNPIANTQSTLNLTLTNFATISDFSGVNINPGNRPRVYYKKTTEASAFGNYPADNNNSFNGWKYQETSAASSPYSFTIDYSLLTSTVAIGDAIQYFVTAQDLSASQNTGSFPARGFNANSVSAVVSAPDTPSVYYIVDAPMSGTYTIGTTLPSPAYTTLTAAVRDLELRGVNGPVIFELTDALYTTPAETFPIVINAIGGASSTNTILIKPAPGVSPVITSPFGVATIKMNGARFVTVDGSNTLNGTSRNMSIINGDVTPNTSAIWIAGNPGQGCAFDTVKNCIIQAGSNTVVSYGVFIGGASITVASGDSNNYIGIVNNSISRAQTGVYIGAANNNTGLYVANNTIGSTVAGSQIGSNLLTMIKTNNAIVEGNEFFGITQTSAVDGVLIGTGVTNLKFNRNSIHDLINTNVNKLWAVTISSGPASSNTFSNNTIYNVWSNATGTLASRICTGFSITSGNGYNFYFNSVSLTGNRDTIGTTKSSVPSTCIYLAAGLTAPIDIRNNIFSNTQTAATNGPKSYALYSGSASTIFSNINYNNYYTSGTQATLAYINGDINTLTAFKGVTGSDNYSINVDPLFTSSSNLSIASTFTPSAIESGAISIPSVSTDFNGNPRPNQIPTTMGGNLAPDIGAFEFDGAPLDIIAPMISFSPLGNGSSLINRTFSAVITDTGATAAGVQTVSGAAPRVYFRKKSDGNMFSVSNTAADSGWKWVESATGSSPFSFTVNYSLLLGGTVTNLDTIQYFVAAQDNATIPNIGTSSTSGFSGTSVSMINTAPNSPYQYIIVTAAPMAGTYTVGASGSTSYTTITAAVADLSLRGVSAPVRFELTDANYGSPAETFPIVLPPYAGSSIVNTVTIAPATGVTALLTGSTGAPAVLKLLNATNYIIDGRNAGGSSFTIAASNTTGSSAAIWLASSSSNGPGCNHITIKNLSIKGGSNTTGNYGINASIDGITPSTTAGMDQDDITIEGNSIVKCYYGIFANGTAATSNGGLDNWTITKNLIGPANSGSDNIGFAGIWMANALNVLIEKDSVRNLATTASASGAIYLSSNINRAVISQNIIRDIYSTGSGNGSNSITAVYLGNNVINSTVSGNILKGIANKSTQGYGAKGLIVNTANSNSNDTLVNNFISDVYCYVDINTTYWPVGIDIEGSSGSIRVYHNSVYLFDDHTGLNTGATGSAALFISASGGNFDIRNNILINNYHNSLSSTDKSYSIYSTVTGSAFSDLNYNNYVAGGVSGILAYFSADLNTLANLKIATGKNANSVNVNVTFINQGDLHLALPSVGDYNLAGIFIPGISTDIDGETRYSTPYVGADENTGSPLPVKLISFSASMKETQVLLNWITASELNSDHFEVERSMDENHSTWTSVAIVAAAGTSNRIITYSLTDNVTELIQQHSVLYYRLKMTDIDHSYTYSKIVAVQLPLKGVHNGYTVFPNPFGQECFIQLDSPLSSDATLTVSDITGKTMMHKRIENGNQVFSIADASLKAGMYFITIEQDLPASTVYPVIKVIKQ